MSRAKNKEELLVHSQENYEKLNRFIDGLSPEAQQSEFPEGTMNRNIRDVLMHLYHWHLLTIGWYEVGMKGEKPQMPAEGYTWKTLPDYNKMVFEKYQGTSFEDARKHLAQSHTDIRKIIESHTNEELFEKKRYQWTGSTSMGAYFVSSASSHYDWALKLIRKAFK